MRPRGVTSAERTGWIAVFVFLAGAFTLFFARALFTGGIPYYRDLLDTCLPLRAYASARLRAGELPQWFPYEGRHAAIGHLAELLRTSGALPLSPPQRAA